VIALDQKRREVNDQLMQSTDSTEALRLHNELKAVEMELGAAEQRWLELNALNDEN
jgi:ATP-binding cassette, subfamily F, member 3